MIEQDSHLPGDLIYGNSHAVYSALERPPRCTYDPRWHWPEPAEPLPASLLAQIDAALLARHAAHILASNAQCVADWLRGMLTEAREAGR